jgi:multiple sugar transport system substrate-binding protein
MVGRISTALVAAGAAIGAVFASASPALAQGKSLTLCWAAWDPANALVELGKDFTAKTGIEMKYEFVPWTSYADRFLNELNSKSKLCDLIIGDSQWIGGAAENGHYVKLNDFFTKEGISMDDFMPATVLGYSEWPKNTPNYWALPAMADAVGWTYRKDWFARPELQSAFKAKYGRELAPPKTYDELKDIAQFFEGREIDGKKVYGAYIFTERGSEGITMGVTNVLYDWGFKYEDPKKPYAMQGFVNSPDAVKGLEFYKALYKCCTAPGMTNAYMQEGLDAFKSGQVAMQMNWFAFFPGLYKDPNVGGDKIGFFVNPAEKYHATQLGGQGISVVSQFRRCNRSGGNSAAIQRLSPSSTRQASSRARRSRRNSWSRCRSSSISGLNRPTRNSSSTCRSAFTTTSLPTKARRRKRSICLSWIGRRCSRKKARSTRRGSLIQPVPQGAIHGTPAGMTRVGKRWTK